MSRSARLLLLLAGLGVALSLPACASIPPAGDSDSSEVHPVHERHRTGIESHVTDL